MKMRGGPFLNESNKFPNKCASPNKHELNNLAKTIRAIAHKIKASENEWCGFNSR